MTRLYRALGVKLDPVPAGSNYDTLTDDGADPLAIDDANDFIPVIDASIDWGLSNLDRDNEVRMIRDSFPPVPFRAQPALSGSANAYPKLSRQLAKRAMGKADVVTAGTPPLQTHKLEALGYGSTLPPAMLAQIIEDDHNWKLAGWILNEVDWDFPIDGFGTVSFNGPALIGDDFEGDTPPTPSFTGYSDPDIYVLRDIRAYRNDEVTTIDNLGGIGFGIHNNMPTDNRHAAGRNVQKKLLGDPEALYRRWWPNAHKLGRLTLPWSIRLTDTDPDEARSLRFGEINKWVADIEGPLLTGGTQEIMRVTAEQVVHASGGPDALSADADIQSTFEGAVYRSPSSTSSLKIEFIDETATAIT